MKYLHEVPVIHRNLATRNVLLGHDLKCKISDFGMARPGDNHSTKGKYFF